MKWNERDSFEYFSLNSLKDSKTRNKVIDEPTSSINFTAEKGKLSIMFSVLHYKYLMDTNQSAYVKGAVDGVDVDGVVELSPEFDGYNTEPGEVQIKRFSQPIGKLILI